MCVCVFAFWLRDDDGKKLLLCVHEKNEIQRIEGVIIVVSSIGEKKRNRLQMMYTIFFWLDSTFI